ncbi:uncharacterized protein LOC142349931 [Convolutriloba macropyga]|uniref:uncharacterized protein LOC142349931 n=1 Tax=Convolutriloba macropyga TaxID=536237 RepID=UPI003F5250C4
MAISYLRVRFECGSGYRNAQLERSLTFEDIVRQVQSLYNFKQFTIHFRNANILLPFYNDTDLEYVLHITDLGGFGSDEPELIFVISEISSPLDEITENLESLNLTRTADSDDAERTSSPRPKITRARSYPRSNLPADVQNARWNVINRMNNRKDNLESSCENELNNEARFIPEVDNHDVMSGGYAASISGESRTSLPSTSSSSQNLSQIIDSPPDSGLNPSPRLMGGAAYFGNSNPTKNKSHRLPNSHSETFKPTSTEGHFLPDTDDPDSGLESRQGMTGFFDPSGRTRNERSVSDDEILAQELTVSDSGGTDFNQVADSVGLSIDTSNDSNTPLRQYGGNAQARSATVAGISHSRRYVRGNNSNTNVSIQEEEHDQNSDSASLRERNSHHQRAQIVAKHNESREIVTNGVGGRGKDACNTGENAKTTATTKAAYREKRGGGPGMNRTPAAVVDLTSLASSGEDGNPQMSHWVEGSSLGVGGFGNVKVYYNKFTGVERAVKQIVVTETTSSTVLKLAQREIMLLSSYSHEKIVKFYGCVVQQTSIYIFMEYIPGNSVKKQIDLYGYVSESVCKKYVRQILQGLQYLHTNQVVHRDLKCANILRDSGGNVKLADFGCAKLLTDFMKHSSGPKSNITGSPYWMAPEVILSQTYDGKADIWSLGCTIVEMITGDPPNFNLECMAAIYHVATKQPCKVRLPTSSSSPLIDFVQKCLNVEADQRPSAADLLSHPFLTTPSPLPQS